MGCIEELDCIVVEVDCTGELDCTVVEVVCIEELDCTVAEVDCIVVLDCIEELDSVDTRERDLEIGMKMLVLCTEEQVLEQGGYRSVLAFCR